MEENKLRQLFKNNSDCYADTNIIDAKSGMNREGEVIQAMTEERFIELMKELNIIAETAYKNPRTDYYIEIQEYNSSIFKDIKEKYFPDPKIKQTSDDIGVIKCDIDDRLSMVSYENNNTGEFISLLGFNTEYYKNKTT